MRVSVLTGALCALLFSTSAMAQDFEDIGLRCAKSKLKAAGRACACVHKAWAKAASHNELPDFSSCDQKMGAAFTKSEAAAAAVGGMCPASPPIPSVFAKLAEGVSRTVTDVARGVVSPAPDACDGLHKPVAFSGGNYSKFPKCVEMAAGDTDCSGEDTRAKMGKVLEKDFDCPACPAEETGCKEIVYIPSLNFQLEETSVGVCCLKKDATDDSKSVSFTAFCTVCISG